VKSLRCKWANGEVVKRLPEIGGGDAGMAVRTVVGVKRLPELRGEVIDITTEGVTVQRCDDDS